MKKNTVRRHYTLIEMLTVIAIIAIIAGLGIPAIGKARRHAQETSALSGCNNIAMALKQYEGAYSRYPKITLDRDSDGVYTPIGGGATASSTSDILDPPDSDNVAKYDSVIFALSGLLPKTDSMTTAEETAFRTMNKKKTQFLQVPQNYLQDGSFYMNPWKQRFYIVYGNPTEKGVKFKLPGQTDVTRLGSGTAVFAVVPKTNNTVFVTSWNGVITLK